MTKFWPMRCNKKCWSASGNFLKKGFCLSSVYFPYFFLLSTTWNLDVMAAAPPGTKRMRASLNVR